MNTNNTLKPITVPTLGDVNYALQLSEAFGSINDNFEKLATHDFIKGETGASITVVEEPIFQLDNIGNIIITDGEPQLSTIGEKLYSAITSTIDENSTCADPIIYNGTTISLWDIFNRPDNTIKMIYTTKHVNGVEVLDCAVSSLYYTFFDGRFVNELIGDIAQTPEAATQLVDRKDFSCVLIYKNTNGEGSFDVLTNSFPTMYYDAHIGLCWKLNGVESGIPVQGVKGKDGKNSVLQIVKCNGGVTNAGGSSIYTGVVSSVYAANSGFVSVDNDSIDITDFDNSSVLVLTPINNDNVNGNGFYFGHAYIENDILYAECNTETSITNGIEVESIISALKNIKLNGNNGGENGGTLDVMRGLFLPIKDEENAIQPVHLLSSTSFTNVVGRDNITNTDVIFTPVNDINGLNINDSNSLTIDKYLYLKVDKTRIALYQLLNNELDEENKFEPYDYILKYKLSDVIVSTNNLYWEDLSFDDGGSRYYGTVFGDDGITKTKLSALNTLYLNANPIKSQDESDQDESNTIYTISTNHIDSMPANFKSRLDIENSDTDTNVYSGVYRWELCKTKDNFDVLEMMSAKGNNYNFSDVFSVVYTIDASPSITSDILWFDGINAITNSYDPANITIDGITNDAIDDNGWVEYEGDKKCILHGWNVLNETTYGTKMFEFVKLIPVYTNSFATDDNSTLNLNYNVNITGVCNSDTATDTRTLNVHGNIGCDTLSVDGAIDAREIKNVYTQNDIVGDTGIKLGKDGNGYNFAVDEDGIVDATGINCETLRATSDITADDKIIAKDIIGNTLEINGESESKFLNVNGSDNSIDLADAHYMTIKRPVDYGDISADELYVLKNDLPVLNNNNSNIIVTEQNNTTNLCMHGVKYKDIYNAPLPEPDIKFEDLENLFGDINIGIGIQGVVQKPVTALRPSFKDDTLSEYAETFNSQVKIDAENTKNFNIGLLNNKNIKQSVTLERLPIYMHNGKDYLKSIVDETTPIDLKKVKYIKLLDDLNNKLMYAGGVNENKKNELSATTSSATTLCTFNIDINDINGANEDDTTNDGTVNDTDTKNSFDNNSKEVKITFKEPFVGVIGVYAEMSYGAWPVMLSGSNFKFKTVYCEKRDGKFDEYTLMDASNTVYSYELKFDPNKTVSNITNQHGDNFDGNEWVGYADDGTKYTATGNRDYAWRNYEYAFKPKTITFNNATMVNGYTHLENNEKTTLYNVITNAYKNDIEFKFELQLISANVTFSSQKTFGSRKRVIKGIRVFKPAPIDIVAHDIYKYDESGNSTTDRINHQFDGVVDEHITIYFDKTHFNTRYNIDSFGDNNWVYPVMDYENYVGYTEDETEYIEDEQNRIDELTDDTAKDAAQDALDKIKGLLKDGQTAALTNACKLTYNYLKPLNDFNTHTICNDGSIIMTNNDIFGLGYVFNNDNTETDNVKVPALFYYNRKDVGAELEDTSKTKPTIDAYIERTKVIPLSEVFDMLEFYNTYKTKLQTLVGVQQ